jgi:hypothetical protein
MPDAPRAAAVACVGRRGYRRAVTGVGRYGGLAALLVLTLGASPAVTHGASPAVTHGDGPAVARAAATCGEYRNQAAAQRAADTADPDRDGVYCVIYSG